MISSVVARILAIVSPERLFSLTGAALARTALGFFAFSTGAGAGAAAFVRALAGRAGATGAALVAFVAFTAFGATLACVCTTGAAAGLARARTAGVAPTLLAARELPAFATLTGFFGLTAAVIDLLPMAFFFVSGL
jgi:hypothetical protein